jgi:hypothetical protein
MQITFLLLYKKRGVYATPLMGFTRLATYSLTGNKKPGGSKIPSAPPIL